MKKVAVLDPVKMTALLRDGVFALQAENIGLNRHDAPQVWGVVLEMVESEVLISLVALADGSVSIYLSDGGGVIGCGLHPDVRQSAAKMLQVAAQARELCTPISDFTAPAADQARVYLLTTDGVCAAAACRLELDEGAVPLAEVYYAGHGLLDIVELLGAGVDLIDEMQLAESALQKGADNQAAAPSMQPRRRCRVLPYAGAALRRSQS